MERQDQWQGSLFFITAVVCVSVCVSVQVVYSLFLVCSYSYHPRCQEGRGSLCTAVCVCVCVCVFPSVCVIVPCEQKSRFSSPNTGRGC